MISLLFNLVLGGVILFFTARAFGKWLFKKDDKFEHIQEALLAVSGALREYGLVLLADFCQKLAIKDFSRAYKIVVDFYNVLKGDPMAAIKMFDKSFDRVLTHKLTNEESRAYLKSRYDEAVAHALATKPAQSPSLSAGIVV